MDLVDFLTARLDEDEAATREAIRLRDTVRPDYGPDLELRAWEDVGVPAVIVGPERVLADVEAKRWIVECASAHEADEPLMTRGRAHPGLTPFRYTLRLLALPYADHPDYRQEWLPT